MISILLPAYNASHYIADAIDSILHQTFPSFELIVIDDGSTDDTVSLVQRFVEQDARVRLLSSLHGGLSRALNLGIEAAQYPWIARMDADDIALPQRLERQMAAVAAAPGVVAWGSYAYHMNSHGKTLGMARVGPTTEQDFYRLRQAGHLVQLIHPTVLLKREVLLQVGGYKPEFEPVEELELFDRMAAYGPTLTIPEPLLRYRVHAQSVSMQRFFYQRVLMRYVVARYRARLAGQPDLSLEQFLQDYNHQPLLRRWMRKLQTSGMFYYRSAGLALGEGQYLQAGVYLGLATLFHPHYSLDRVWQQVLSPETRRLMKQEVIS
ncbi:MAG TPA: glycosyltransferase family A protein [Allocoleopsis sp.]